MENDISSKAWSKDGNFNILEVYLFLCFCEQLPVIQHTLQTFSSTFILNIKCTFNNLLASFRRLAIFCGSLLLGNRIFIKPNETVHFDFEENSVKSVSSIGRHPGGFSGNLQRIFF